jgi:hypothetical protein
LPVPGADAAGETEGFFVHSRRQNPVLEGNECR